MTQKSEKIDEDFIIDKMIKLIEKGWCQGGTAKNVRLALCLYDDVEATSYDLLGALMATVEKYKAVKLYEKLKFRLVTNLGYDTAEPIRDLTTFNDRPTTTKADVIAFLKKVKANANKT